MEPIIDSPTSQTFDGRPFRLHKGERYLIGYWRGMKIRIHRAVWEYHNGPIPHGYHIHHIDGNQLNNTLSNLEMKSMHDHLSEHMTPERREYARKHVIEKMVPLARAWHSTPEGFAWHSMNAKKIAAKMPMITKACEECGKEYQVKQNMMKKARFCHLNCKMRRYRRENPEIIRRTQKKAWAKKKALQLSQSSETAASEKSLI